MPAALHPSRGLSPAPPRPPECSVPHTHAQPPPAQMNFIEEALLDHPVAVAPPVPPVPRNTVYCHTCAGLLYCPGARLRRTRPASTPTPSTPKLGARHTDDAQSETERDCHPELLGPVRARGPRSTSLAGTPGKTVHPSASGTCSGRGSVLQGTDLNQVTSKALVIPIPLRVKALGSLSFTQSPTPATSGQR